MKNKRNTWAWVYADECAFLWEHFGMVPSNKNDRMKIKFVEFEASDEQEEDD